MRLARWAGRPTHRTSSIGEQQRGMTMWVYIRSEPELWTVGFYDPAGTWHADSDHSTPEAAAQRVHWLNGH